MKLHTWRRLSQIAGTIIPNSYIKVFFTGDNIYQGPAKGITPPILNCYATPSAYTSCPIGELQHFMVIRAIPYYLIGLLGVVGISVGRLPCGWICPFGFIQTLLDKIPVKKWKMPKSLRYLKYVVLVVLVFVLPYFLSETFFCKICPAGALTGGIPQMLLHSDLHRLAGLLYWSKVTILAVVVFLSIFIKRFFCRSLCPLGAILGLFNKVSIVTLQFDESKCISCNLCSIDSGVCPMEIEPRKTPNSPECIRCMRCVTACPTNALSFRQSILTKPILEGSKG